MEILFICGILLMLAILGYMLKLPKSTVNIQSTEDTTKISDDKLFSYILPNNKGRSIDNVVATLEKNKIEPEFHVQK